MRLIRFHVENKEEFNDFVRKYPFGNIHQCYEWGEFQTKLEGRGKFWALGVGDQQGELRGTALVIRQDLPFGKSWLMCPRGPLVSFGTAVAQRLFEEIEKLARKEGAVFLRIDPLLEKDSGRQENENDLKDKKKDADEAKNCDSGDAVMSDLFPGFRRAHASYQPECTSKIDLRLSEKEILAQMKPKGRYNIGLAQKKGVIVHEIAADEEARGAVNVDSKSERHNIGAFKDRIPLEEGVSKFYRLLGETTLRDGFQGHSEDFYLNMLKVLGSEKARLFLAEYEGEIVAGIIVNFFEKEAIYYFGASGNQYRNMMAPYLLQWEAIRVAKKIGCLWYDLLGIAPEDCEEGHPWQGVTEFKKKFGGKIVNYQPALESVYRRFWYQLMLGAKKIREL